MNRIKRNAHWLLLVLMLVVEAWSINQEVAKDPNQMVEAKNVLGGKLKSCCTDPMTGFFRDGTCHTGPNDYGVHVVCAVMTDEFLEYTKSQGNDLSTPAPEHGFPGLKAGDGWCLCAARWREAYKAGKAPKVILESTHERALRYVTLEQLQSHATKRPIIN